MKEEIWAPIVEVYKKYGLKRRFRRVEDGLWIFGQKNVCEQVLNPNMSGTQERDEV